MAKLAVLEISTGSFETGFAVRLQVGEERAPRAIVLHGQLPPAPAVLSCYESWQIGYRSRGKGFRWKDVLKQVRRRLNSSHRRSSSFRQIQAVPGSTRRRFNLKLLASDLEKALNDWLDSGGAFQKIRDQLLKTFSTQESVRLIIQTDQLELWKLPWEVWHLVQEHPNVGLALSKRGSTPLQSVEKTRSTVRILALLGDSTNINIQRDLELLQQHLPPEAELYAPKQVGRSQLNDDLWTQSWDILFFAGHSSSQAGEGKLYLTADTYLTIPDLKYALSHAIAHGLQLAIFNSCDGLELARDLVDLQLPATILMREPVPDEAAQKFLGYFLEAFAQEGRSLYGAVEQARQRLQGLEDKYPCVGWLPLICQNPLAPMLWWRSFLPVCPPSEFPTPVPRSPLPVPRRRRLKLQSVVAISLAVTCLVMGVRMQGYLQPFELKAYDHLMQLRPVEGADPRLLVVQITDADEQKQNAQKEPGTGSLHDPTLQKLLSILDKHQPAVVGIDIYRDQPVTPSYKALSARLSSSSKAPVIGICKQSEMVKDPPAPDIPKPPDIPSTRIGFSNLHHDSDRVSRRYFLRRELPASQCETEVAFSLQLALHYLNQRGTQAENLSSNGILKLKSAIFTPLGSHSGGYQNRPTNSATFSTLLNYRPYNHLEDISASITLQQLLSEEFKSSAIKNKVILIGRIDNDSWTTPYNVDRAELKTPGVYLHAQAVSQILAATLDDRRLFWWLPIWGDFLWVWLWAGITGILARQATTTTFSWLPMVCTIGSLLLVYVFCWMGILLAVWLPMIPAGIALVLSTLGVVALSYLQIRQHQQ